jgi:hypothetical protein
MRRRRTIMKGQIMLGVGAGYLLGRTQKLRWALTLAAAAAGGRLGKNPGQLVQRGMDSVGKSAGADNVAGGVSGRLLEAGRSAAASVVTRRIESLTDKVRGQADAEQGPDTMAGADEREPGSATRGRDQATADNARDDDFDDEPDSAEDRDTDDDEPERAIGTGRRAPAAQGDDRSEPDDGLDDEEAPDSADDEPPVRRPARPERRGSVDDRRRRSREPRAEDDRAASRRRPAARSADRGGPVTRERLRED